MPGSYSTAFKALSLDTHQVASLTGVATGLGVAGITGVAETAHLSASTANTLGTLLAVSAHYIVPAVTLGMGISRIFSGAADLGRSFTVSETDLQEYDASRHHRFPIPMSAAARLRCRGIYTALTGIPVTYFGVEAALAAGAGSFSSAFAFGAMGLGIAATADFLAQAANLMENKKSSRADVISTLCKGLEAAGWFLVMSHPVVAGCFLAASFLHKLICGTVIQDVKTDLKVARATLFPSADNVKDTIYALPADASSAPSPHKDRNGKVIPSAHPSARSLK